MNWFWPPSPDPRIRLNWSMKSKDPVSGMFRQWQDSINHLWQEPRNINSRRKGLRISPAGAGIEPGTEETLKGCAEQTQWMVSCTSTQWIQLHGMDTSFGAVVDYLHRMQKSQIPPPTRTHTRTHTHLKTSNIQALPFRKDDLTGQSGTLVSVGVFFVNWGIVVLQCCVSFYCAAKWSSLCYTAGSH